MQGLIKQWALQKNAKQSAHKQYLKRLKNKKPKNIDAEAEKIHNQVFKEINCLNCANCCTSIPPLIIKSDIKRIAKFLKMTEKQFTESYVTKDADGDDVFNQSPCKFLESDNRCAIYDVRPKACRAYPHTNHFEFSRHYSVHAQNTMYCPAVFHIIERLMKKIPN